jgi:hypothetical protein
MFRITYRFLEMVGEWIDDGIIRLGLGGRMCHVAEASVIMSHGHSYP